MPVQPALDRFVYDAQVGTGETRVTERDLLADCLRRLNEAHVTCMLTGSMASNAWGIPRTTHDLDFVIPLPPSQVTTLAAHFTGDYHLDEPAVLAAYHPPHPKTLTHPRKGGPRSDAVSLAGSGADGDSSQCPTPDLRSRRGRFVPNSEPERTQVPHESRRNPQCRLGGGNG